MRHVNETVIDKAELGQWVASSPINSSLIFSASAQIIITGEPGDGACVAFQASNDVPISGVPSNWSNVPGASIAISAPGIYLIPKFDVCYEWLRLVYTGGWIFGGDNSLDGSPGSGTATVNLKTSGY